MIAIIALGVFIFLLGVILVVGGYLSSLLFLIPGVVFILIGSLFAGVLPFIKPSGPDQQSSQRTGRAKPVGHSAP